MRAPVFALAVVCAGLLPCSLLADRAKEVERVKNSTEVFGEVMKIPEKAIPDELLSKAECIVIVPGLKKGGFVVGAHYGRGVVSCRAGAGRAWSPPSMLLMTGGSFGLQIGGQEIDVIMLIMNKKGRDFLLKDKFTLGGDVSAAAGPVGRAASAETNAAMRAEILTYSRARGLFAGVTLKGAVVKPDNDGNRDLYGREMAARNILDGQAPTPAEARPLLNALSKYR
jgi:lipid-binding SYLF domain-containing protein